VNRTPEQLAADKALTDAIEQALHAYNVVEPGDVIQEYVVVVATESLDAEGDSDNGMCMLFREGRVHSSRAIGLLEDAKLQIVFGGIRGS
jgi:hypothetical protein